MEKSKELQFDSWGFGSVPSLTQLDLKSIKEASSFEGVVRVWRNNYKLAHGALIFSDKPVHGDCFEIAKAVVWEMLINNSIKSHAFLVEVPEILMRGYYYDEEDFRLLSSIETADIVVFHEVAPAKYNDRAILKMYNLFNMRTKVKKPFIITSSVSPKEITLNVGVAIAKLLTLNCALIEL